MNSAFSKLVGSIGILLFKRSFFRSSTYITLQAFNSILGLVAMLLPLKIILVMGSANIPSYFPFWFQQFGRVDLVMFLAKSAVFAFILSTLIGKLANYFMRKTALKLFQSNERLAKRHDDEVSAIWFYVTSLRALTSLFLSVLMVSGIGYFYQISALVVFCSMVLFSLVIYLAKFFAVGRKLLADERNQFISNFGAFVFFVNFSFLVVDNIYLGYEGYYSAILALIMSRHAGNQFFRSMNDFRYLYKKGDKGMAALSLVSDFGNKGIGLLNASQVLESLFSAGLLEKELTEYSLVQVQSGIPNVYVYRLHTDLEQNSIFYVKVFTNTAKKQFHNEKAFLEESDFELAPALLGTFKVSVNVGALYQWRPEEHLEWHPFKKQKAIVLATLVTQPVSEKLKALYFASELNIFGKSINIRKQLARLDDSTDVLYVWDGVCKYIQDNSSRLGLSFHNPDIRMETLYISEQECVISHWGRWSVGFIGEGWPISDVEFKDCIDRLMSIDPSLRESIDDIRFAAVVSYAITQYEKGNMLSFSKLCIEELARFRKVKNECSNFE